MSSTVLPSRQRPLQEREQLDLFRALPGDMAPRDSQDLMAYPFFSLGKSKRVKPIDFRAGNVTIRVEGTAEHGIATIWDADVLIWAASQIVEAKDAGLRPSRLMRATPYEILRFIGRGTSLRDYQRELAERTTLAQASQVSSSRQLGFSAAGRGWLIDLSDAAEIMPVPAVTPVPGTQAWFLGLINHRGKLTGVIDFEQFLGHEPAPRRSSGRLIVLSDRFPVACALRVASVSGLMDPCRRIGSEQTFFSDTKTPEKPPWQGREERINDRQWHRLDVSKLMSDSRFADASL